MSWLEWLVPWEPSATVVVTVVLAAGLYLRGCMARHVPWPRQLAFWLGLTVIYVGLHTHLDYYAEHEFFIHRIQHLGLHHLGPFLIALAYPGPVLRAALPLRWRVRWLRPALSSRLARGLMKVLLQPAVAGLMFVGLIYMWLWPSIHFDAMLDWRLYRLMNISMAVDGLIFWWLILDPRPRPPARLAPGTRVILALLVIFPQILLGAYITFTHADLYPIYDLCGRAFAGITPATDQYLGGLILWIPSSMMSVIAALLAFHHWVKLSSRGRLGTSA
ncbi:MAG: cytochrome c oxidase assembly protein [Rudaea sp.]